MRKLYTFLLTLVFACSVYISVSASAYNTSFYAKSTPVKSTTLSGIIVKHNPGVPISKEMTSLKASETTYILNGNIKSINKYIGYNAEITGRISTGSQGIQYFYVQSYKIIAKPGTTSTASPLPTSAAPTVTPSPTPTASAKTHTLESDKILYLSDPNISNMMFAQGNINVKWTENTQDASFEAKVYVPELNVNANYEFKLVEAVTCSSDTITGTFNIIRNGNLVEEKISGTLYGLNNPVGSFFKFFTDGEKWHLSAYVTKRTNI